MSFLRNIRGWGAVRTGITCALIGWVLAGCAGTVSGKGDGGEVLVFAVTEETAYTIIRESMRPIVMEGSMVQATEPHKGYTGTVKLGLDRDRVTAVMVPAKGRNAEGAILDGYKFEVLHSGTAASVRIAASRDIMKNIIRYATTLSEPLVLVSTDSQ